MNIEKTKNYKLQHKLNKSLNYELASVVIKDKPEHQLYKIISQSNKEFLGVVNIDGKTKIEGISITEFYAS